MPAIQSKLTPITTTCIEYVHPWTKSCSIATAGLILQAAQDSFRIYSIVYTLSLFTKGRIPNRKDIKRTIQGIIQSTAFLTTSAFSFCLFLCIIRKYIGSFNFFTVSYVPAFMSSICAILLERSSRRGLLSLYVANVATETLFRMAVSRGLCTPIDLGQVYIFGISLSIILYYFRKGLHHKQNDSLFDIIRFVIGNCEEKIDGREHNAGPLQQRGIHRQQPPPPPPPQRRQSSKNVYFNNVKSTIMNLNLIQKLFHLRDSLCGMGKHPKCPHGHESCPYYCLTGGIKLFGVGVGIQLTLKILFQLRRCIQRPTFLYKLLFNYDSLKLGVFLGGFSSIFRLSSCALRHLTNKDLPIFAIPSCLLASLLAFRSYPDTTIALYVMWKMFQITYNIGVDFGWLPKVPGFLLFLYCASTATLFHAAILEPTNLRPSYWKFLHSLSGGRVAGMDRKPLDIWGLKTSEQLLEVLARTKTNLQISFTL